MPDLKLIAFDTLDLGIISAHLQDAVLRVGEMTYLPKEKRFAAIVNRFDWANALGHSQTAQGRRDENFERRRAGIRFERVNAAQVQGIDFKDKEQRSRCWPLRSSRRAAKVLPKAMSR